MNRGDVYWTDFGPPAGVRPALILTRDAALPLVNSITVAPLTSRIRRVRSWVLVTQDDGLPNDSCVNLDSIQTVHRDAFVEIICRLPADRLSEVGKALRFALDADPPPPD